MLMGNVSFVERDQPFLKFKCPHIPAVYRGHSAEFYQTKSVSQINSRLFISLPATAPCVIGNDA